MTDEELWLWKMDCLWEIEKVCGIPQELLTPQQAKEQP